MGTKTHLYSGGTHSMSAGYDGCLHVLEAVFADVEFGQTGILLWVGRGVPSVHLISPKLQLFDAVVMLLTEFIVLRHLKSLK